MQLLFSVRQTIATLVKYRCKTFIKLTPGQDNLDLRLLQRSRSTFSRAEQRSSVNKILATAKREVSEFLCDYTIIFNYTFLCILDSNFPTFAHLLINVYQFLHSLQDIKGIQGIDHHPFDN